MHTGQGGKLLEQFALSAAIRSMLEVEAKTLPIQPRVSYRCWSDISRMILGRSMRWAGV